MSVRRRWVRRWVLVALAALVLPVVLSAVVVGVVHARYGWYGVNVMLRRGMTTWSRTGADDLRLPPGMRLALGPVVPPAAAGELRWRRVATGLELAELSVLADGVEVDRVLLSRIDPHRFRFEVLARPAGDRELGDWMTATGAVVAVNGSFYAVDGSPDTPILTQGKPAGPSRYTAGHGAFVEAGDGASVRDLSGTSWQAAFTGASDALVSYPMLIGADGRSRATHGDPALVANRSFVAADRAGRIVLGTTIDAFFTLDRLADFLRASPLDLRLALNLDGGPVACQAVRTTVGAAERDFCGRWETARHDGHVDVLGSLFGTRRAALPLVLVAHPR